jgi:hypothetical protein
MPCSPLAGRIRRVVLLGPCHRVAVRGLATPTVQAFATPLGSIPLDRAALDALADLPQVVASDAAHAQEHSLEVQLPFLQTVLGEFKLVPLAVGQTGAAEVAQVIARLWGGPETLIVISSDLSHFHGYAEAQKIDRCRGRTSWPWNSSPVSSRPAARCRSTACSPWHGSAACASNASPNAIRATPPATSRASSATPPSRCTSPKPPRDDPGPALLVRARNAIAAQLGQPTQAEPAHPAAEKPGATFVTLTQNGALRGCIGSLQAHRPLDQDVRANAVAAAFQRSALPAADGRGTAAHPGRSLAADRAATDDFTTKPTPCASCGRMSTA